MKRSLILFLLSISFAIPGATAEPVCGEKVLELERPLDEWHSWGHVVAAGYDGNFLSVTGGSTQLLDPTGAILRQETFAYWESAAAAAVSADELGYLVFWAERSFAPGSNLHLARFDLEGRLQATKTLEIGEGRRAIELDADSRGSQHLLAWTGTDGFVHRFLVTPTGAVAHRHYEFTEAVPCSDLTVAAGAAGFAVTVSAQRRCEAPYQLPFETRSQVLFLDSAGDLRRAASLGSASGASVTSWNDRWLVVWASGEGVMGREFDREGLPAGQPALLIDEPTAIHADIESRNGELFLLWYSDVVEDSACGINWDIAASRVDAGLRETERHLLGWVFESHCPPSGYTGPFQPYGDVACTEGTCFMTHGEFAAIAGEEAIEIHGGPSTNHPVSAVVSVHPAADGSLSTLLVEDALEVARFDGQGIVEARKTIAQLGTRLSSPVTTMTSDGRFALITVRDGDGFYGWIVDTRTLEIIRSRIQVPGGRWAGAADSFLVSWVSTADSQQSLHLSIFGLDGQVRMSTPVMEAAYINAVPAYLVDRFVVLAASTEGSAILEVGAAGGAVASYPTEWGPDDIANWGAAGGQLVVARNSYGSRSGEVIVVDRGGVWRRETFPLQTGGGSGGGAMFWDGKLWMSSSWSNQVFGEVGGDEVLHVKGRLIEADDREITSYSIVQDHATTSLRFHALRPEGDTSSISFGSTWHWFHERDRESNITLVRTGSLQAMAEVRVSAVNPGGEPLPLRIPDPVVRFLPGEVSKELGIFASQDLAYQDLRTVLVLEALNEDTSVECDDRATVTVYDDDAPALNPQTIVLVEGDEVRTETLSFTIAGGFLRPTMVDVYIEAFAYHAKPAEPGKDIAGFSRSILVQPGQQVLEIPITILGDHQPESTETFHLRYWYGKDEGWNRVIVSIIDDDTSGRRRSVSRP